MMVNKENRILTAVGPDKIGLVEKIAEFIVQHRCNIEDSKMAVFCGEFALIVLISGAGKDLRELSDQYRQLADHTTQTWPLALTSSPTFTALKVGTLTPSHFSNRHSS